MIAALSPLRTTRCARLVLSSLATLVTAFVLCACGGGGGSDANPNWPVSGGGGTNQPVEVDGVPTGGGELRGGALVTFREIASGNTPPEVFSVWTTDAASIAALGASWNGTTGPVGHIITTFTRGIGLADHNNPWSWHVDPRSRIRVNPIVGDPPFIPPLWPSLMENDPDTYILNVEQTMICTMIAFDDRR